jgi:hypothetical protein
MNLLGLFGSYDKRRYKLNYNIMSQIQHLLSQFVGFCFIDASLMTKPRKQNNIKNCMVVMVKIG